MKFWHACINSSKFGSFIEYWKKVHWLTVILLTFVPFWMYFMQHFNRSLIDFHGYNMVNDAARISCKVTGNNHEISKKILQKSIKMQHKFLVSLLVLHLSLNPFKTLLHWFHFDNSCFVYNSDVNKDQLNFWKNTLNFSLFSQHLPTF